VLLDIGLDPNERVRVEGLEEIVFSAGGPLRECTQQGKLSMAKMLLDSGADPNVDVYAAGSAVFVAYGNKNWEMVKLLESYGGCLNAASVGYVRQTEIAKKMLAGEIDPKIEAGLFSGATVAEQLAWSGASGGDTETVRMALQQLDWARDDPRWFWLLWRPLPGHEPWSEEDRHLFIECFRLILQRCDPNLRAERYGQTMLHEVISRDHEDRAELARMLLDAGARTDVRDDLLKSTPLGWACRWGRIESVKLLLERGADSVEPDAEPWATPQAWAEKKKRKAVLELLKRKMGS
jgi:ankyrin repeat protein